MNYQELRTNESRIRAEALSREITKTTLCASLYGASAEISLKFIKDKDMQTSVANGNFIVGSVREDGSLSFATRAVIHPTESAAKKEVERLLGLNPDTRYAYLELKGIAYTKGICWNTR